MNAQEAAKKLFEKNQFQDWLIAVGVACDENGNPTGIVVHVKTPNEARLSLPDKWQGYDVAIHKSTQPKVSAF
ncbi:MAG: hypothetical protein LBF92_01530 [Synergistaceae bacterium]|jgi:hypothetical protein|nr:hypothetical protein [Synergistaceae bacterium]